MGHHHHTHHHHHHGDSSGRNIRVAFFLNLSFTIVELVGGILTNSTAILSDALHDFGDSLSLGLAWYFQRISSRSSDSKYSYGYRRFSLLGALINSTVLIVGSIFILMEAIPRLWHPQEAHAAGMMGLAVLGILVNGAAVLKLKNGSSQNEKVVSLHLMEDVLGWVAVLIGGIIIYFTGWYIIDPILTLGITAYVLYNVYGNMRDSLNIILQGVPTELDMSVIREAINGVEGVQSIHDLHIWSLDGQRNILTVHVVLSPGAEDRQYEIRKSVNAVMAGHNINHCTIEMERDGEECVLVDC